MAMAAQIDYTANKNNDHRGHATPARSIQPMMLCMSLSLNLFMS